MFFFKRKKLLEIETKVATLTEMLEFEKKKTDEMQMLLHDICKQSQEQHQALIGTMTDLTNQLSDKNAGDREKIVGMMGETEAKISELQEMMIAFEKSERALCESLDKKSASDAEFQKKVQERTGAILSCTEENGSRLDFIDSGTRLLLLNSVMEELP